MKQRIESTFKLLKILIKIIPGQIIWQLVNNTLMVLGMFLTFTYSFQYVLGQMEKNAAPVTIFLFIGMLALFMVISILSKSIFESIVAPRMKLVLLERIHKELFRKAVNMDLDSYNEPEFYDDYVWILANSDSQFVKLIDSLTGLFAYFATILLSGAVILSIDWLSGIFIVVSVTIISMLQPKISKKVSERSRDIIRDQRQQNYVSRVHFLSNYVKDMRTTNIAPILKQDYQEAGISLRTILSKYGAQIAALQFCSQYLSSFFCSTPFILEFFCFARLLEQASHW